MFYIFERNFLGRRITNQKGATSHLHITTHMNTVDLKKHKKNIAIGTLSAALIFSSGLAAVSAAEPSSGKQFDQGGRGNGMREFHDVAQRGDYGSYQNLVSQGDLPDPVSGFTEAEFAQIGEMISLHKAGDIEGAEKIRVALGLPDHPRGPMGMHKKQRTEDFATWQNRLEQKGVDSALLTEETFNSFKASQGDRQAMEALQEKLGLEGMKEGRFHKGKKGQQAEKILEMNYDEWAAHAAERGMPTEQISQATFDGLQKAATLFEAGDRKSAKTVLDELGLKKPEGQDKHNRVWKGGNNEK